MIKGHVEAPDLVGQDLMIKDAPNKSMNEVQITWPSTDRASEVNVVNAARTCATKNNSLAILDHIPEVLRPQDYSKTPASDGKGRTRILRVMAMDCFHPMVTIKTLDDFVKVMIDVVDC